MVTVPDARRDAGLPPSGVSLALVVMLSSTISGVSIALVVVLS